MSVTVIIHAGEQTASKADIYDKFTNLVKTNFIQRCPRIKDVTDKGPVPQFEIEENLLYRVPAMETEGNQFLQLGSPPIYATELATLLIAHCE